ncbi:biotin--[acetyl-CoA-carboxylase] ligase [Variovorax dokdonensis]|uniref:Biotin--[acetyl-CoA-carboxylase] ligase n=1 Tax=Variovorax dokdonensis TaxID=344883 RepID=A0ABT7N9I1_9BURK|nr:biotin--[acetyl-CoA-carboxylase] ligase [Variovorax dokdonensis]MDM0044599.1 biotin--[acetyl-CoA-carboxylase] ligase [Variovorax dokdonensis]
MSAADWPMAELEAQLASVLPGCRAEHLAEVDSTNTELMRRARSGVAGPVLLVADRQTAGRGRMGRSWQSAIGAADPASLTFSLGLPLAPKEWSGLSLAVGVALADCLDPDGRASVSLKWPNDLWVEGRKLGGILVETASSAQGGQGNARERHVVIGAGINIAKRPGDGMRTPPACVHEWQPQATAPEVLLSLAAPLLRSVLEFAEAGFGPLAERFARRDALRGHEVALSDGRTGRCEGVGPGGELRVRTGDGVQAITSAEVSVRPSESRANFS